MVLARQMFKWAWRQRLLNDYRFSGTSFPKANPQPCFTSKQVDQLMDVANRDDRLAFALMGNAGLRMGEVEQLRWNDLHKAKGHFTMIQVRRGGSLGTTKDKDDRFAPVHPIIGSLLGAPGKKKVSGKIFRSMAERQLLLRLKKLCEVCDFANPNQYKLHTFRHHFASLFANHQVA